MSTTYKTIQRHVITGFIFIMPVLITIVVLARFWDRFMELGGKVTKLLRIDTLFGPAGDAVVAVLLFLIMCVVAGFLVKMSFFKRISDGLDRKLAEFIPGYSDIKKETETKIGVSAEVVFETCLVQTTEHWKPAYLIDVDKQGNATVFMPVAPTFATGHVSVVPAGAYRKLNMDSKALNTYLAALGKGLPTSLDS